MSREMLQLAEALASEKNVETEVVFKALEFALSTAAKKKAGIPANTAPSAAG